MPHVELSRITVDPRRLADAGAMGFESFRASNGALADSGWWPARAATWATPALAGANDTREAAGNT